MTVTVRFFASLRERLGEEQTELSADGIQSVRDIRTTLMERGDPWQAALNNDRVLVAVNQAMAKADTPVGDGDEVAFFPPVTGG